MESGTFAQSHVDTHAPLTLDEQGVIGEIRQVASPNRDARPAGTAVELVVIHNISLPPGQFSGDAIERLFTNTLDCAGHPYYAGLRGLRVSSHFLLRRDGTPIQFVACSQRAWHAGESSWRGRAACNDFSVGIELEGADVVPFTDRQYAALKLLIAALRAHYPIAGIAGHSEIAPGRKTDPGPCFDWQRISR
jgi:N-acetyl-anhydromuramoyl-L-alanine amidase